MSDKLKYFIEAWEMNGVGQTVATVQDSPGTVVTITVDDLRALLARPPAAIDKEAEYALVKRGDLVEHSHPQYGGGLFATEDCFVDAPLANEASKPAGESRGYTAQLEARVAELEAQLNAAPSVAQDERGGMVLVNRGALQVAINMLRRDAEEGRAVRGELADELSRAASTSANVAQGAEAVATVEDLNLEVSDGTQYKYKGAILNAKGDALPHGTSLYTAPPAQSALTDAARDAAAAKWATANTPIREALAFIDGFDAARELTAAQSASASEGK